MSSEETDHQEHHDPVRVPENKICPFISNHDVLIECLREKCGVWMINECSLVRLSKGKTAF